MTSVLTSRPLSLCMQVTCYMFPCQLWYACMTILSIAAQRCSHGTLQLVSGWSSNEGRVVICINGVWGTVCDDGWDSNDARVMCTQLGYSVNRGRVDQVLYWDKDNKIGDLANGAIMVYAKIIILLYACLTATGLINVM